MRKSSSEGLAREGGKFLTKNYSVFFDEKLKKKTKFQVKNMFYMEVYLKGVIREFLFIIYLQTIKEYDIIAKLT